MILNMIINPDSSYTSYTYTIYYFLFVKRGGLLSSYPTFAEVTSNDTLLDAIALQ